jgi:hypothetical protein
MTLLSFAPDLDTRRRLAGPAARGFRRLARAWKLTVDEQLQLIGHSVKRTRFLSWDKNPPGELDVDQLMRASYLLGIYEGLERWLRESPAEADAWVRRANSDAPFLGETPLGFMLRGGIPAIAMTRAYIDAVSGGPPSREESLRRLRA